MAINDKMAINDEMMKRLVEHFLTPREGKKASSVVSGIGIGVAVPNRAEDSEQYPDEAPAEESPGEPQPPQIVIFTDPLSSCELESISKQVRDLGLRESDFVLLPTGRFVGQARQAPGDSISPYAPG